MTEGSPHTTEEAPGPRRRKPGTGFPVVSLADAATIVKEAGKYGFEHSLAAFAGYMGHSSTNSGAFRQRLAAFRDWKLLAGRGDNLVFTDIGKMIAMPTDEAAEHRALRAAFNNYSAFSKLYEGSAKGTHLSRKGLASRAVHEFAVAPQQGARFVDSFVESAVTAGLAETSDDGQVKLLPMDEEFLAREVTAESSGQTAGRGLAPGAVLTRPGSPVVRQSWTIPGGLIIFEIRSGQPLPAGLFVTVGEVVASLETLARALAQQVSGEDSAEEDQ